MTSIDWSIARFWAVIVCLVGNVVACAVGWLPLAILCTLIVIVLRGCDFYVATRDLRE